MSPGRACGSKWLDEKCGDDGGGGKENQQMKRVVVGDHIGLVIKHVIELGVGVGLAVRIGEATQDGAALDRGELGIEVIGLGD